MTSLQLKLFLIGLGMIIATISAGCREAKPGLSPTPEITPATIGSIAFVSQLEGDVEIYVIDADSSNQRNLTNSLDTDWEPDWSPDGLRIAFGARRYRSQQVPYGNWDIYVMNADGTNRTRLTTNPAADWTPKWSPDGSRILFLSDRDGNVEVYVMQADGSNQARLTNDPDSVVSATWSPWSPDSSRITFGSIEKSDIYLMNADGSNRRNLTNDPTFDAEPVWSPDGSRIAFESHRDGKPQVYVMDADGANQRNLSKISAPAFDPAWSPDGSRIAFCSYRNGNNLSIYVMDADGSNEIRLTTGPEDRNPAWSPDGSRIAFLSRVDRDWYISVMNADGSDQTRLVKAGDENASFTFAWSPK